MDCGLPVDDRGDERDGILLPLALRPPHVIGIVSLLVLAVALYARYAADLAGRWRAVYAVSADLALYLNAFVAVAQAFQKLPPLHALAPKQTEPPFAVAQIVVLVGFVVLGRLVLVRFHPQAKLAG